MRTAIVLSWMGALALLAGCACGPDLPGHPATCAEQAPPCPKGVTEITLPGCLEPVYETRREPIYETRRTPVWGEKTVPVFRTRKVPVTVSLPDPCTCCDREFRLWEKEERVQVGVRRVRACLGYREERVQVGSCPTCERVGWKPAVERSPAPCPPGE